MTRRETFDKKQQKLERMEKIVRDAIRLKDAIKSEVDAIMEEIDAEINSPKKAKPVFWDGKQPHYWRENGKMFRKAMKHDIGKTVIVCKWDDPNPLSNLENKALLEGITQFDDFTVRSTNGSRLCHFPLAWVDCHPFDTSFDDVPHICVFMGNALTKVADKLEQADQLIDEESFLKPEPGTVAEEKWSPRIGDWVRIKKCVSACCWVGIGMDYLDGQIRQVEKLTPVGQGVVVDCFYLCENSIAQWEPREGEKVQVINVDRVYEVQGFDRITKMVFCVGRSHGIELRLLKPHIEQPPQQSEHIADANEMVPGDLLVDTTVKFKDGSETVPILSCWTLAVQGHPDHVEGVWVEEAAKDPEKVARYDSDGRDVTELAGLWTDGDTQYREPTGADVGKTIEVRSEFCTLWEERQLVSLYNEEIDNRFVCRNKNDSRRLKLWSHARIKVEG